MARKKSAGTAGAKRPSGEPEVPFLRQLRQSYGGLASLYSRLPKLPLLDRDMSAIVIVSFALYAAFMLAVFLATPHDQLHATVSDSPLEKNALLSLLPGERYGYNISGGGNTGALLYSVSSSSACQGMLVSEYGDQGLQSQVCLTPKGQPYGAQQELNFGMGNQSILLFSPWMLGVSENFSWSVQAAFAAGGSQISVPITFQSQGLRSIAGRRAFEVLVSSEISPPSTYYVDSEKRILLLADFGNITARLVSAPFPLNWSSGMQN